MTSEEMERAIEFLLNHQAKVSVDIAALTENVNSMRVEMEANRAETREAINNLIVANEVTRKLSEDVTRLAIQTSQRVTSLEHRVDKIESTQ